MLLWEMFLWPRKLTCDSRWSSSTTIESTNRLKSIFSCFYGRCFFDPGSVPLIPEAHLWLKVIKFDHDRVHKPSKIDICMLLWEMFFWPDTNIQTNKQTNAFNFFRMTLPSVEGTTLLHNYFWNCPVKNGQFSIDFLISNRIFLHQNPDYNRLKSTMFIRNWFKSIENREIQYNFD